MKIDTAVAKILKLEGVDVATGFPNVPLQEAMAKEKIRHITFRSERVAVEANIGFSRSTFGRKIGVSSMQGGPGLEVAFPALREAYSDSVPVLLLPTGDPVGRITTNPNFNPVVELRGVTKWVDSITQPARTVEVMRRAFTRLRMGRPRPVVVEIPWDMTGKDPDEFDDALFQYKPVKVARAEGDPADIREVARALIKAKKPLIRAGQGVLYAMGWDELQELAELLEIPVMTTMNGKSAFPENHPLSVGAGGRTQSQAVVNFLKRADLILMIGESYTLCHFITPIPSGKKVMQVTIDETDINKDYPIEQAVIGDAKLVMRQLIDEIKKQIGPSGRKGNGAVAGQIKADKEAWLKKWLPKLTSNEIPINPYRVYWDVMKAVNRKETIITYDSGSPRDSITPFWESLIPGGVIGYGKDHMLGSGLGFIMGAKMARPEKFCLNFMGDGAIGMVFMNFETASRAKIPITTVVFNNGELTWTKMMYPVASERYGIQKFTGDYSKVAEALGGFAQRVEKPEQIIPAVHKAKEANDSGVPALIEIMGKVETDISIIPVE